uniref:Structural maintenance of chromosomes protein n=1 Tax=Parastrongyloides trichosuri TaxID=131310 RepID=A0A0N5A260_PARTI
MSSIKREYNPKDQIFVEPSSMESESQDCCNKENEENIIDTKMEVDEPCVNGTSLTINNDMDFSETEDDIITLGTIDINEYTSLLNLEIPAKFEPTKYTKNGDERLMIEYIELENFKSYYGVNKLGPYGKNFSCIIGPNGSGKSNIFDCMLFVFDYNVQKFRTKKLSDLIHKSANSQCNYARVSIHFKRIREDKGKTFDVKGSFFCVSRKITIDNKSFFYINSKKVSRDDVKNYLRGHGLGLDHDRFLILQGEVESIALLKPKAEKEDEDCMLGLIDDIIGTGRYKRVLLKLNDGISTLQGKVSFVRAKLKESEKFRDMLRENVESSIEQNRINNCITDLKYILCLIKKHKTTSEISGINEDVREVQEAIKKYESEDLEIEIYIKNFDEERIEIKRKYNEARKKDEVLQNSLLSADFRSQQIKVSLTNIEKKLNEKLTKGAELCQEMEILQEQPQKLMVEKESMDKKLLDILSDEEKLIKEKEKAEVIYEKERKEFSYDYNKKEEDLIDTSNKMNVLKHEKEKLMFELEELTGNKNELEKEVSSIENFIKNLSASNKEDIEKKDQIKNDIFSTENELNDLKERSRLYESKIKENETRIMEDSRKYDLLNYEYNELTGKRDNLPTTEIYKFLLSLKCKGFRGRLGDLASIDNRYDVALSTLGGQSLGMFVVDTIKDAQYLMNELKSQKKGKASFLCIDEMRKNGGGERKVELPDRSVRAFDLLKFSSPEFKYPFYYLFRDSLVVEKLEDIERVKKTLSINVPKIVTLDGSISESSGKITGGGRPLSKLIGSKDYVNKVLDEKKKSVMEVELSNLSKKLAEIKQENRDNLEKKYNVDNNIKKKKIQLDELSSKLTLLTANISNSMKCIEIKQSNLNNLKNQLDNLDIDEEAYDQQLKRIGMINIQIEEMEKILFEKSEIFKFVKNKVDNLYENIVGKIVNELKKCVENKQSCQNSIDQLRKKLCYTSKQYNIKVKENIRNEKEITTLKNEKIDLEDEKEHLVYSLVELNNEKKENTELLKKLNDELNSNVGISEKKVRQIAIKDQIRSLHTSLSELNQRLNILNEKISLYEKKSADLKYTFFNSFNLLPQEFVEFMNDEAYFSERVYKAENEFLKQLNDGMYNRKRTLIEFNLKNIEQEELNNFIGREEEIHDQISSLKSLIKGNFDKDSVINYIKKHNVYLNNLSNFNNVNDVYEKLKSKCEQYTLERIREFNEGFNIIANCVKKVYQKITFGGDAELESCDKFDPYNFGILYQVRPPGKAWKKMRNLSGGEKTLASLSLIFALHEFTPTPLYIMDEIDAALDFRNVGIIGEYIKERTLNAQFIVISLRKEMYELADKCIQIWKIGDKTRTVCSDINQFYKSKCGIVSINDIDQDFAWQRLWKNRYELLKNVLKKESTCT